MDKLISSIKQRNKVDFINTLRSIDKHNELLIMLINAFATTCTTNKIKPIREFYKHLVEYQQKKSIPTLNTMCKHIFQCYEDLPFREDHVNNIDDLGLLYRKQRNIGELDSLRGLLNEEIMGLLDVLWDLLTKEGSDSKSNSCLAIVKYIIEKVSPKDFYKKDILVAKNRIDAYDLIMNFLSLFLECFQVDETIASYLKLNRELFFYKCRAKDRPWRVNFIYCSIYVLSKRSLTFVEEDCPEDVLDKLKKKSYAYLNVITRIDSALVDQVRSTKNNAKAPIYYSKAINVADGGIAYLNTSSRKPQVIVNKK